MPIFVNRSLTLFVVQAVRAAGAFSFPLSPVTPRDCVSTRDVRDDGYHKAIQINRQGSLAAYIMESPNIETNRTDFQLYIWNIRDAVYSAHAKLLLTDRFLSEMQWLPDGKHLLLLAKGKQHKSIVKIDVVTGSREILWEQNADIEEYSADQAGNTVVFAVPASLVTSKRELFPGHAPDGFRISFQPPDAAGYKERMLYVIRRAASGGWTNPRPIEVRLPGSNSVIKRFPYYDNLHLSLSLDGSKVLLTYYGSQNQLPPDWSESEVVREVLRRSNGSAYVLLLYDLKTGTASVPFNSPLAYSTPVWSSNGQSFLVTGTSPIGTKWEADDTKVHPAEIGTIHLFEVRLDRHEVEEVAANVADLVSQPLFWNQRSAGILLTSRSAIEVFSRSGNAWDLSSRIRIRFPDDEYSLSEMSGNEKVILGVYQSYTSPPKLFRFDLASKALYTDDINTGFQHLAVPKVEHLVWKTSAGHTIHGALFVPPDYRGDLRYPLVIQAKPEFGQFVCGGSQSRSPSFVPLPLADSGILYLIRDASDKNAYAQDSEHYPAGFPGGIAEAAYQEDIWDSAIGSLEKLKPIDSSRIGIIGFSRSGWYVEFMLTEAQTHFAAASVTDNVQYTPLEYWYTHALDDAIAWKAMYGGPPEGDTLINWLRYSSIFHLTDFHTPLLMEAMGNGAIYANSMTPPLPLATHFDLFSGLSRLKKPVELYYYPDESHEPQSPRGRLSNQQRNADWFRFWLQGYERPEPSDPEQYARWERMRREEDNSLSEKGKDDR